MGEEFKEMTAPHFPVTPTCHVVALAKMDAA
jgi:hypothetical protein